MSINAIKTVHQEYGSYWKNELFTQFQCNEAEENRDEWIHNEVTETQVIDFP